MIMIEIKPRVEHGVVHRTNESYLNYHGWPSVCKDKRGVLFAAASGFRMSHVDPCGKSCMYVSFDEGKSWTPPVIISDTFLDDRDTGIYAWGDGNMIASWFNERPDTDWSGIQSYDWFGTGQKMITLGFANSMPYLPEGEGVARSYVKMSKDYGVTWSEKVAVPVTSPHGPVALKDGSIVYMGKYMNPDYLAPNPICVYTSKDGGYTWEYTGTVPPGDDIIVENMHEPHMIELPNGRLLGAIRIHERKTQPDFTVYITYSDDKGKTWSTPKCLEVDGAPPHLMVHSSGAIICSYSRRRSNEPGKEDRGQRACVSYDGGETWTEDYDLRSKFKQGDHGYPATVELSDGSLLTVYYMSHEYDGFTSVLYTKWRLGGE